MIELDRDLMYWVWLSRRLGVASRYIMGLLDRFDDAFDIYCADSETLAGLSGFMSEKMIQNLLDKRIDTDAETIRICEKKDISIIHINDPRYPKRLRAIQDPPTLLYVKGRLPDIDGELCVGIVGTRKVSEYGCRATYRISNDLSRAGAVTVSGLALGVDGIVAAAALAENAPHVAVLGTGIDVVYPSKHQKLYDELVKRGTVISEYAPGIRGASYTFPKRNRIISGLSQATFVVEADIGSGAMITAKDALVQGREIFALPGNIGASNSRGTNELIREGAHPVLDAKDILGEFSSLYSHKIDMSAIEGGTPEYDTEVLGSFDILPETHGSEAHEPVGNIPGIIAPRKSKKTAEKPQKTEKAKPAPEPDEEAAARKNDKTVKAYEALDPKLKAVYDALPKYGAVSVDAIKAEGLGIGEIIASLTLLEIQGLVKNMPGGVYMRA